MPPTDDELAEALIASITRELEDGTEHFSLSGRLLLTHVEILTALLEDDFVEIRRAE